MLNRAHLHFEGVVLPVRRKNAHSARRALHIAAAPAGSSIPLHPLAAEILRRAQLDPTQYRADSLNRRVAACLRAIGADGEAAALRKLDARPEWLARALDALLLGVTDFFRDPKVFEVIQRQILPELIGRGQALRVWSAACSDGQELYSVALLLEEMGYLDRCDLMGSDWRTEALQTAASGAYLAATMPAVPPRLQSHFEQLSEKYQVPEKIRRRVRWQRADLLSPDTHGAGTWDMILWRNMAIYLTPEAAARVWRKLTGALAEGGYLITGKAERPPAELPLQRVVPCVYRRLGDRAWRNT